jgi:hypothetical protein
MYVDIIDIESGLKEICETLLQGSVSENDLKRCVSRFQAVCESTSRPIALPLPLSVDHPDPNISEFFKWLQRASCAESSQELSEYLSCASLSLQSASLIVDWTATRCK